MIGLSEARHGREPGGELTPEERWPDTSRLWRAMMLAPSLEVCEALLRGESVPIDRLDPVWVRRFGLKR